MKWMANPVTGGAEIGRITAAHPIAYLEITPSDNNGDISKPLDTSGAGSLEVLLIADADQTTATPAAVVSVYAHPGRTGQGTAPSTINGLPMISGDTDGDGIQNDLGLSTAVNRRSVGNFKAPAIVAKIGTKPAGSERALLCVIGQF